MWVEAVGAGGPSVVPSNLYRRGGMFYWRAQIGGQTYRKSTGMRDREMAKRKAREFDEKARASAAGWVDVPTFDEWVARYFKGYATMRRGAVLRDKPLLAPALVAWKSRRLDTIRRSDCEQLIADLTAKGFAPGTVGLMCIRLKLLFRLAVDDDLLKKSPWGGVETPQANKRHRVLTADEQAAVSLRLRPSWRRAFTVLLGTGLRKGEFLALAPAMVDCEAKLIRLPAGITKTHKSRVVPLRPEVELTLAQQLATRPGASWRDLGPFWSVTGWGLAGALRKAANTAGVARFSVHDLRRTFGTRCAEAGMPLAHLQAILGHSNPAVTMGYYVRLGEQSLLDSLLSIALPGEHTSEHTGTTGPATPGTTEPPQSPTESSS